MNSSLDSITSKFLNSAKLNSNEKLVIVTDNFSKEIGDSFLNSGKNLTNLIDYYNLDNLGERPLKETPKEIMDSLKNANLFIQVISKKSNTETNEHITVRKPLIDMKYENKNLRVGSILDVDKNKFLEIFKYDPNKIIELNKTIKKLLTKHEKTNITIKTNAGTNLQIKISTKYNWINQDANLRVPSSQHSLLAGEVYGYPDNVEGIFIVDGVMGGEFSKYGILDKNPLKIEIKNSLIENCSCENKNLETKFKEHIRIHENANKVGELGFGTNIFLDHFYGVLGIDEKFPGIHIAFGHPYAEKTGAEWTSPVHVDCVIKEASAWIEEKQILKEGKYLI